MARFRAAKSYFECGTSTFDRERVQLWLEIWQELTADRPEFELPLRLLAKAIEYKEKNGDPRVLLTLAIEEREILKQLLEETSIDYKGR